MAMAIPFFKELRIGGYMIKQKLLGRKRYPLVLMLEPLFRCNLACAGCGRPAAANDNARAAACSVNFGFITFY